MKGERMERSDFLKTCAAGAMLPSLFAGCGSNGENESGILSPSGDSIKKDTVIAKIGEAGELYPRDYDVVLAWYFDTQPMYYFNFIEFTDRFSTGVKLYGGYCLKDAMRGIEPIPSFAIVNMDPNNNHDVFIMSHSGADDVTFSFYRKHPGFRSPYRCKELRYLQGYSGTGLAYELEFIKGDFFF